MADAVVAFRASHPLAELGQNAWNQQAAEQKAAARDFEPGFDQRSLQAL